ncbi:Uncharacterised protein [uncultured archaeon]|nr:Uncharacterised protein [uncultured archaeon]
MNTRLEAKEGSDLYVEASPWVCDLLHNKELECLESFSKKDPILSVIGPGEKALPYSYCYVDRKIGKSNRERIKRIVKNGSIIFADYRLESLAIVEETLERAGFFDRGFFVPQRDLSKKIDFGNLESSSIYFMLQDLRNPITFPRESLDMIDMTLSGHHAYTTISEARRIFRELYKSLRPEGFLHLGEGKIDMNYPEEKMIKKALEFERSGDKVVIIDNRENDKKTYILPPKGLNELRRIYLTPEELQKQKKLEFDSEGNVFFENQKLKNNLIDPKEDYYFISSIDNFYQRIKRLIHPVEELKPMFYEMIDKEQCQSGQGLSEHYLSPEKICELLRDQGYLDVDCFDHINRDIYYPFVNITARKE